MMNAAATPPPPPSLPAEVPLQGLGGWLLAVIVAQGFYLLVDGLGLVLATWQTLFPTKAVRHWPADAMRIGMMVIHGINIAVAVYATVLLAGCRMSFPKVYRLQLMIFAFVPIAELLLYHCINWTADGRAAIFPPPPSKYFVNIVIAFVLLSYVGTSTRVRNTFVR